MNGGRHPSKSLTATQVKAASEPGKYYDGNGLFLRISKTGNKSWVQRLMIRGKRKEIGLGAAQLVSLAEARTKAFENRKLAREGGDPLQERRTAKAIMTFEEAARAVHEAHKPTWRNEKHAKQFLSTLETYAFPKIGNVKVSEVTTADVLSVLSPIWVEKAETARRVKQRLGMVLKWAVAQGWRQDNPADAIAKALPKHDRTQKHRKALPYSDIAQCLRTIKGSSAGITTKLALELVILTACRSGEVRLAKWEEIDLEAGEWLIPAQRMKAKKEHKVPLTPRTIELLEEAKALQDESGLVFPGTKKGKPLSDMTLSKLVKELGYDVDVHGFRTTFRTWAQERTNTPREVVEKALAHTIKDKAEAAYARSDLFEKRRKLMESWAAHVLSETAKVVNFRSS